MNGTGLTTTRHDRALDRYMAEIVKYPVLTREDERAIAERYRKDGDLAAAHELVLANLRFVVRVCRRYRGYGVRMLDLIQEGNIGLIQAVREFDPDKGFRLISYAVWWIKAALNAFVMRSWSLVKIGTTQRERKLFFKLRSARSRAEGETAGDARASTELLVERLDVSEKDLRVMEGRLAGRDVSLEGRVRPGAMQASTYAPSQEDLVEEAERARLVRATVATTMESLSGRERYLVENRLMAADPETLQQLGDRFRISRERARQLETSIKSKLRKRLVSAADEWAEGRPELEPAPRICVQHGGA
jgi:RNA polymerase sigma-32 factor